VIEPEPLQQIERTYVLWRGRKFSYFAGCDYFRLSSHPRVQRALTDGLKRYGLSVAASRLTTGNHALYLKLEQRLAHFFRAQAALLVPNGYVANLAVAQTLAGQFSHALIDEAAHLSLIDAAEALDCPVLRFSHRSAEDVSSAVRRCGAGCKLILLTDGMFSSDGSVPPLKKYLSALPEDAVLLVDDAHAAGVLGINGRGSLEHEGVSRRRVIQTITLSKSFGTYGGAVLGSNSLRRQIVELSHVFVGSTPLPLPLANAAAQALAILDSRNSLRQRLLNNTLRIRNVLQTVRVKAMATPGPIVALEAKHQDALPKITKILREAAIYPPYIQYPGAPPLGHFRFVISSEHSLAQLDNLARSLSRAAHLLKQA
jgi:7-keto-8-aminopelargonate synthetase-like enzyme